MRRTWVWAGLVAAITALDYRRSLGGAFLEFDDPFLIVGNPHIRSLDAENLRWMFGLNWLQWYPLSWLSLALDYSIWGLDPFGFHLTSVLLHALNAALAFRLFESLMERSGAPSGLERRVAAAAGALLFSLHPLRAESVSWASERSDVLSASFALGCALAWVARRDRLALALHAAGLAAKGIVMGVPVALWIADRLGLTGRPPESLRAQARRLAPFLVLSALDGLVNAWSQTRGAAVGLRELGALDRLVIGLWNYAHECLKTLWPSGLQAVYPLPQPFDAADPGLLAGAAAVLVLSAAAWRWRRRWPAFAAAWGAFLVILAPVAGFFKVGPHLAADRYSYLSTLGFFAAAAELSRRALLRRPRPALAALGAAVLILAALSWKREADWLDSDRLWRSMLRENPRHGLALHHLGRRALEAGRLEEAELLLRASAESAPDDGPNRNMLGLVLSRLGRAAEAEREFRAALAREPERPVLRHNLAVALIRMGRREEAAQALREELALLARRGVPDPLRVELGLEPRPELTRRLLDSLERRR